MYDETCYNDSMKCLYCGKKFIPYEFGDGRQKFCSQLHQYKDWIKKHPERAREISQKSKTKHREKRRQEGRKYYADHKEEMKVKLLAWRRRNKAKTVQQVLNRYYKTKGNGGTHTLEEWNKLKKRYLYRCAICKKKKKLTRDHITPISKGGTNDIGNIQPLCRPCNSKKFNHILER